MGAKNFVNQFKNTRRQASLNGRHPLGGQVRNDWGKTVKNSDRARKIPKAGQRPAKKYSGPGGK
jgi:hypothetical protein